MTSPELERLTVAGRLTRLAPAAGEIKRLIRMGSAKLQDARKATNSPASRFDLAYNGAHALALAALRHHGFRSNDRYVVFQVLGHTIDFPKGETGVLIKAHGDRNRMEYEAEGEVDPRFLDEMIQATTKLEQAVRALLG